MSVVWAADMFLGFDGELSRGDSIWKANLVLWDAISKSRLEPTEYPESASAMMQRWSYPENKDALILEV